MKLLLREDNNITLSLVSEENIALKQDEVIQIISGEHYTGPTEVTPNNTTQILPTSGLVVSTDIVVNPIPSNYGLVSYNGFYLMRVRIYTLHTPYLLLPSNSLAHFQAI